MADNVGVLATVASGILTRATSSWAAEWAGKLEAWHLAEKLGVTPAAIQYVGADCTSATLGSDGGVPSQSPWVDRVRVAFAEALGRSRPDLYVPAQHNTQWSGLLSGLQARAHNLAAEGLGMVRDGTYPLTAPSGLRLRGEGGVAGEGHQVNCTFRTHRPNGPHRKIDVFWQSTTKE